jgi:hypothetical protein
MKDEADSTRILIACYSSSVVTELSFGEEKSSGKI